MRVQPNGNIVLRDLNSTNGTYIGREGEFLHRMKPDEVWELQKGDIIGFGGPETIVARSEQPDIIVANPFLFKYSPLDDLDSIPPRQPECVQPGYYGVLVSCNWVLHAMKVPCPTSRTTFNVHCYSRTSATNTNPAQGRQPG